MLRSLQCAAILLLCLTVAACQSDRLEPKKYSVSGTVTLDGKPLTDDGLIYFKTIATGAMDVLNLKAGKYSGTAEPGDRRVEIVVVRTTTEVIDRMTTELKESLIPARYNTESKLAAKVTPEGPNLFNFDLESK